MTSPAASAARALPDAAGTLSPGAAQAPASSYVRWFQDTSKADVATVGGKGANLGEMTGAGFPVPPGFVVTVDAYRGFDEANRLGAQVAERLARLDVNDPHALRAASEAIQALVRRGRMPDDVRDAVLAAYATLSGDAEREGTLVAVRSSGTVEDTAQFSFAGMFQSVLNVRGPEALARAVKECWASGFSARLLFYRAKQGLAGELLIAAVVQKMVQAERAGVVFTADPATNDRGRIIIEGAW